LEKQRKRKESREEEESKTEWDAFHVVVISCACFDLCYIENALEGYRIAGFL